MKGIAIRASLLLCAASLCECARLHRLHRRSGHFIDHYVSTAGSLWQHPPRATAAISHGAQRLNATQLTDPCGKSITATARSETGKQCPAECPLHQEDVTRDVRCSFQCVPASGPSCSALNTEATVPDLEMGVCRSCWVPNCQRCMGDGTDTCKECKWPFQLRHGKCFNKFWWLWVAVLGLVVFLAVLVVSWVVSLALRPVTNQSALDKGLELRSRAKLHMPVSESVSADSEQIRLESTRVLWPLSTNLCWEDVAGPAVVLSFNFQVAVIFWALLVAGIWAGLAFTVDTDLLQMGTREANTPRDNCITHAWGFQTQRRLMWLKVDFLIAVYVITFAGCLIHSVLQLRRFQKLDELESTHKDYAVKLTGIPPTEGDRLLEDELKFALECATERNVVGVSVCWVFESDAQADLLRNVIDLDIKDREHELAGRDPRCEEDPDTSVTVGVATEEERESRRLDRFFGGFERMLIPAGRMRLRRHRHLHKHEAMVDRRSAACRARDGRASTIGSKSADVSGNYRAGTGIKRAMTTPAPMGDGRAATVDFDFVEYEHDDGSLEKREDSFETVVHEELEKMTHNGQAYAIFNTEVDRNEALRRVGDQGIEFEGSILKLAEATQDPDSILWQNAGSLTTWGNLFRKLAVGFGVVLLCLLVWVLCFFGPYAYFVTNAQYSYGQEPSFMASMFFTMIVVGGNAIMYQVCSEVADRIGFLITDDREVCYMLLYCFACILQVVLDMIVTYQTSYLRLLGMHITTYDGTPIHELGSAIEKIESYPMQQELGRQVYTYSWPSTFLVPFVAEPLVTILIPYQVMVYLVRSHRAVSVSTAEAFLTALPFDLSRYSDIYLNIMLSVLILFFPGGYTLTLFLGLVASHIFIYAFDHWRILRVCPSSYFSTMRLDLWVQWLLSIPCGLILAAYVFKSHCSVKRVLERPPDYMVEELKKFSPLEMDPHDSTCDGSIVQLAAEVVGACIAHVIVHTLLLAFVVPLFGRKEKIPTNDTYERCSRRFASSFFSTNPVHCLRSHYIFRHSPPCDFRVRGKEHLLRANPEIGCYFQDTFTQSEDYTIDLRPSSIFHAAGSWTKFGSDPQLDALGPEAKSGSDPQLDALRRNSM